jgi:hypothetical protein
MRPLRHLQRHTIAAAISVVLLTVALYPMTRQGLLGDLLPTHSPLRSAALLAFALTFAFFLPCAILFDWLANRRTLHPALAPVMIGAIFASFWIGVELTYRNFAPSVIPFYLTFGALVAVGFCAYWIPLRMLRRKFPA